MNDLARSVRLEPRHLDVRAGGALGRPEAARRDRAVVRREPVAGAVRRADLGARRLGAGRHPEPARSTSSGAQGVSYVFISHDLAVVRYVADRIAVMYLGQIVDVGPADAVFEAPHHPYTEALLSAIPTLDPDAKARMKLHGTLPSPADPPSGCRFHTRCPRFLGDVCTTVEPPWQSTSGRRALPMSHRAGRAGPPSGGRRREAPAGRCPTVMTCTICTGCVHSARHRLW